MEHIISLISDYAGDISDLKDIIAQRAARVTELERKIARLERNMESARELYAEGYQEHELDLLMGCDRY